MDEHSEDQPADRAVKPIEPGSYAQPWTGALYDEKRRYEVSLVNGPTYIVEAARFELADSGVIFWGTAGEPVGFVTMLSLQAITQDGPKTSAWTFASTS